MASSLLKACFRPGNVANVDANGRQNDESGKQSAPERGGSNARQGSKTMSLRLNQSDANNQANVLEIEVDMTQPTAAEASPAASASPTRRQSSKKGSLRLSKSDMATSGETSPRAGGPPSSPIRQLADQRLSSSPHEKLDRGASSERNSGASSPFSLIFRATSSSALRRSSRSDSNANSPVQGKTKSNSRNGEDPVVHGRALFKSFLKKCYSDEVLDYWDMSTHYIKLCKKRFVGEQARDLARTMVQEYVLPGAPQKLDLGEPIEDPLLKAYQTNDWQVGSFDPTRTFLLKLLQGLRMDASVSFGVKSTTSQAINAFLEAEERLMNQLMFQRDVHPLLHKLRKSTTYAGSSSSGVTSGSGLIPAKRASQSKSGSGVLSGLGRRSVGGGDRSGSNGAVPSQPPPERGGSSSSQSPGKPHRASKS